MANGVVEPEIVSKNGDRGGKPEGAALDCRRTCGDVGVVATASPARGIRHQRNQGLALAALAVVGGCNREAAVRGICGDGQPTGRGPLLCKMRCAGSAHARRRKLAAHRKNPSKLELPACLQ
jgi:hypothetical protein